MPAERFPAQAEKERYLNVASPVVFARDVLDSGSMPVFVPRGCSGSCLPRSELADILLPAGVSRAIQESVGLELPASA